MFWGVGCRPVVCVGAGHRGGEERAEASRRKTPAISRQGHAPRGCPQPPGVIHPLRDIGGFHGDMDAYQYVRDRGGIVTTAQLRRARRDAETFLARPDVKVVGNLAFLPGVVHADQVRARLHGGVITCVSAARHHGIPLRGQPGVVHLAVPSSRTRVRNRGSRTDVVVHRETQPISTSAGRVWLADPATTVNRMLLCCDEVDAVIALDHVLTRKTVRTEQIRVPGTGPSARRVRRAVARCRPGARSLLETVARLDLEDAGIPVEVAVRIDGVGEVDMLVGGKIVVETDGKGHAEELQWLADRERDLRLAERGFVVVRLTYKQVMAGRTVPVVRRMLAGLEQMPVPERVPFTGGVDLRWFGDWSRTFG